MLTHTNRLNARQHPIVFVEAALNDARTAQYYSGKTAKTARLANEALDGYVGPAVNISNDNEERDVSRQGAQLKSRASRATRYINRSTDFQQAVTRSNSDSVVSIDDALDTGLSGENRRQLLEAKSLLLELANDRNIEQELGLSKDRLNSQAGPRLAAVEQDAPGTDVSHHGKPLQQLFGNTVDGLDRVLELETGENGNSSAAIALLEEVRNRLEP